SIDAPIPRAMWPTLVAMSSMRILSLTMMRAPGRRTTRARRLPRIGKRVIDLFSQWRDSHNPTRAFLVRRDWRATFGEINRGSIHCPARRDPVVLRHPHVGHLDL